MNNSEKLNNRKFQNLNCEYLIVAMFIISVLVLNTKNIMANTGTQTNQNVLVQQKVPAVVVIDETNYTINSNKVDTTNREVVGVQKQSAQTNAPLQDSQQVTQVMPNSNNVLPQNNTSNEHNIPAALPKQSQEIQSVVPIDSNYHLNASPIPVNQVVPNPIDQSNQKCNIETFGSKVVPNSGIKFYGTTLPDTVVVPLDQGIITYPIASSLDVMVKAGNEFLSNAFDVSKKAGGDYINNNPLVTIFPLVNKMPNPAQKQSIVCYYKSGLVYVTYDTSNPNLQNPEQSYTNLKALNDLFHDMQAYGTVISHVIPNVNRNNREMNSPVHLDMYIGKIIAVGKTVVPGDTICLARYALPTNVN